MGLMSSEVLEWTGRLVFIAPSTLVRRGRRPRSAIFCLTFISG